MMPEVVVEETDDPGFIVLLNSVVRALLIDGGTETLWIIKIDNWFDHKWLAFSGYGLIASDIPVSKYDTVKEPFYQEKLTFPPFTPNRVLAQWSYIRTGGDYTETALPSLPHGNEKRHSEMNLRRRIQDVYPDATFIWYSGNTVANGRGSVMVYSALGERHECWFAAFKRQSEWELLATKGISRREVEKLRTTV